MLSVRLLTFVSKVSYNLVFTLNYDPTSHQVNGSGTVKWSLNRRDLNNAALTRDWVNGSVT